VAPPAAGQPAAEQPPLPPPPADPYQAQPQYAPPVGGYAATAAPAASKTSLPVWSLILGILSFVCLPVILAIAAIITGFMGRSRAKQEGSGTGMATSGIVLGIVNLVISAVVIVMLIVGGVAIFGIVSQQVRTAEELESASLAAEAYGTANNSYEGLSTAALTRFGYTPSSDVTVVAKTNATGTQYCVEGAPSDDPGNVIHMPASGVTTTITVNGRSYVYGQGGCGASFQ